MMIANVLYADAAAMNVLTTTTNFAYRNRVQEEKSDGKGELLQLVYELSVRKEGTRKEQPEEMRQKIHKKIY